MPLYKMTVAYDGTRFAGFQRQTSNVDSTAGRQAVPKRPHWDGAGKRKRIAATIQECLEDALMRYVQDGIQIKTTLEEMCLKLAGRTDRGVHARGQVIAVRLPLASALTSLPSSHNRSNSRDASSLSSLKNDVHNGNSAEDTGCAAATTAADTTDTSPYSEAYFICMEEIRKGINSRLPVDICVAQVQELAPSQESFEPRHDVQRKVYSYTIKYRRKPVVVLEDNNNNNNSCHDDCSNNQKDDLASALARLGPDLVRDPFDSNCLWIVPWALDDRPLKDLCQNLQGHHNFRAFVHKKDRNERDHVLTVDRIELNYLSTTETTYSAVSSNNNNNTTPVAVPDAPIVVARFEFEAKGFRRSMIRNLVGFCVDVCRGYEPAAQLSWEDIWTGDDRAANAINAAAASGLCLERVTYWREERET